MPAGIFEFLLSYLSFCKSDVLLIGINAKKVYTPILLCSSASFFTFLREPGVGFFRLAASGKEFQLRRLSKIRATPLPPAAVAPGREIYYVFRASERGSAINLKLSRENIIFFHSDIMDRIMKLNVGGRDLENEISLWTDCFV